MWKTSVKPTLRAAMLLLMFITIFTLGLGTALAKSNQGGGYAGPGQTGGYTGPGPDFVTAEQAKSMADDSHVALKGYIIKSIGGEKYVFKDDSGTVTLDISAKRWAGQQVGPEDLVEVYGEIDKDWFDFEIEVKRLVKL